MVGVAAYGATVRQREVVQRSSASQVSNHLRF